MDVAQFLSFVGFAALAAYVQTVTGFAFGLIMVGGVALIGVMSPVDAAAVVSALSLVNGVQMITRGWRRVAWREFGWVTLGSLPMVVVGIWLLNWMASERADLLRLALGALIILASLQLALPSRPGPATPGAAACLLFGAASGFTGGLFSAPGPPLVYLFYRTALPLATIRETLVTAYAATSVLRLVIVAFGETRPPASVWLGLLAFPAVMAATAAARRWPPRIAPRVLRLVVFALLALTGLALALPALIRMAG